MNTHGRPGKNTSCDLHLQHNMNREVKNAFGGLSSNITEQSVKRMGKSIKAYLVFPVALTTSFTSLPHLATILGIFAEDRFFGLIMEGITSTSRTL